jgi:hypothetical protein
LHSINLPWIPHSSDALEASQLLKFHASRKCSYEIGGFCCLDLIAGGHASLFDTAAGKKRPYIFEAIIAKKVCLPESVPKVNNNTA